MRSSLIGAVALGGAAGTLLRVLVAEQLPPDANSFPWDTFMVNVAGCAVLGFVMWTALQRKDTGVFMRALLGTGLCGGLTTFSTLMVEVDLLVKHGSVAVAVVYLLASLAAGLVAVGLGTGTARLASKR